MKIVCHGSNASTFEPGFTDRLDDDHEVTVVSDALDGPGEGDAIASADAAVRVSYARDHPQLSARLYQLPAAGHDKVAPRRCEDCEVSNCFGHEQAIRRVREGGPPDAACAAIRRRQPAAPPRLALLGWRTRRPPHRARIGEHRHRRPRPYRPDGRRSRAGVREAGPRGEPMARERPASYARWRLDALARMMGQVDIVLNALPLTDETYGLIGANELAEMRPNGIDMNVGRGPVIDEDALYEALAECRIGGAVLDTWYVYPSADDPAPFSAHQPFHQLRNVALTPHMSGWTEGTIARRRTAIAENRFAAGHPLLNILRPGQWPAATTSEEVRG